MVFRRHKRIRSHRIHRGGFRRHSARRGFLGIGNLTPHVAAVGYGAFRGRLASMLQPLISQLPFGQYADEGGMLLGLWAAGKFLPRLKPITTNLMYIEEAQIGQQLSTQGLGSPVTNNNGGWV